MGKLILTPENNLILTSSLNRKEPLYLDAPYYIEKVLIPPLKRVFELVGADVTLWYKNMPKVLRAEGLEGSAESSRSPFKGSSAAAKFKIDSHFRKLSCLGCGKLSDVDGKELFGVSGFTLLSSLPFRTVFILQGEQRRNYAVVDDTTSRC